MPEQKQGFMAELDQWSESTILNPLRDAWRDLRRAQHCRRHQRRLA